MGLPVLSEPNDGDQMGVFVAPSSISASNQSRSDARTAYFDTVLERSNLHIASGQMVTQILLAADGDTSNASAGQLQRAVGVEVSRSQSNPSKPGGLADLRYLLAFSSLPRLQVPEPMSAALRKSY